MTHGVLCLGARSAVETERECVLLALEGMLHAC